MPLRREQVIDAAVELLDEVGLDSFTTRALTDRLGVQRGALYWHVKSKHELLCAAAAKIMEPVLGESLYSDDIGEGYTAFAHRMRAAMLAHRDGARLVATYLQIDQHNLAEMEQDFARMRELGIPPEMGARFGDTIASYVTGFVLQEQAEQPPRDVTFPDDWDPAEMPNVAEWLADGHPDSEQVFTACVRTIILGMLAEVAALG